MPFPTRGKKENADRFRSTDFSDLYKLGAVLCYIGLFLWLPVSMTVPMAERKGGRVLFIVIYLLSAALGYGLQALTGKVLGFSRSRLGEYSYEDSRRYYNFAKAIPCHLAAFLLVLSVSALLDAKWMWYRSYYDAYSAVPLMIGLAAAFMLELGSYLWFYPYNSLITMRRILPLGVLLLINIFLGVFGFRTDSVLGVISLLTVCFSVSLFMLILNQSFISRSFGASTITGVNDNAKLYSTRIVGAFLLCVFGAPFLIVLILKLLWKILTWLGRLSIKLMIGAAPEQKPVRPNAPDIPGDGNIPGGFLQGSSVPWWFPVLVILGVICLVWILYLLFPRVRAKIKALWALIREFIRYLRNFTPSMLRKKRGVSENINYTDTESRTRKRRLSIFGRQDDTLTYKEFEKRLEALPTDGEKLEYAYAVAAKQLEHQSCQITKSDTPREIAKKVKKRDLISDIDELTASFEDVHYAETVPEPVTAQSRINRLRVIVRQYLL